MSLDNATVHCCDALRGIRHADLWAVHRRRLRRDQCLEVPAWALTGAIIASGDAPDVGREVPGPRLRIRLMAVRKQFRGSRLDGRTRLNADGGGGGPERTFAKKKPSNDALSRRRCGLDETGDLAGVGELRALGAADAAGSATRKRDSFN